METVTTENQFLTEEEKKELELIQDQTQLLVLELGEIEMIKIQIQNRYENAKSFLTEISQREKEFTKIIFEKYGNVNVDPKTGEITKLS